MRKPLLVVGLATLLGAPCHSQAPSARFAGCYQLRLGPWTYPPTIAVPYTFRLDTAQVRGDGLWWAMSSQIVTAREAARWRLLPDSTLQVTWATPMYGTSLSLRQSGDSLRGTANSSGDVRPESSMTADAVAWRVSCQHNQLHREVTGTITDTTLRPIPHSIVQVVGTSNFGVADDRGHYRLCDVPTPYATLRAVYIGYVPLVKDSIELRDSVAVVDFRLAISPRAFRDTISLSAGAVTTGGRRRPPRRQDSVEAISNAAPQTCPRPRSD